MLLDNTLKLAVGILCVISTIESSIAQCHFPAFTHPIDTGRVSIYSAPNIYAFECNQDEEGGWEIEVIGKSGNYFYITSDKRELKNVWIHIGDVGVVIQNYDSIPILIYTQPNTTSFALDTIYQSCIGLVYDYSEHFTFLRIMDKDNKLVYGWVENKYLCGSPYTTCLTPYIE